MKWPLMFRSSAQAQIDERLQKAKDVVADAEAEVRLNQRALGTLREILRARDEDWVKVRDERRRYAEILPALEVLRERSDLVLALVELIAGRPVAPDVGPVDLLASARIVGQGIGTQDNRATAHPIYYVEQRVRDYGYDCDRFDAPHVWVREDEFDVEADEEETKRLDELYEDDPCDTVDGWERVGFRDRWERVQPFFTLCAAEDYMRSQRHNLRDPRIFVGSAYANFEWILVRRLLAALSGTQTEAKP